MCDLLLAWVHVFGLVPHTSSQTIISVSLLPGINGCSRVVCTCTPRPHDQLLRSHSTFIVLSLSPSAPLPPSSLGITAVSNRSVSYTFTTSPTSGVTYRVTFTTQREGIRQPPDDTTDKAGLRTKSGLIPDVDYTLQVFAVLNGVESTAVSATFTTLPGGKSILPWQLMFTWLAKS